MIAELIALPPLLALSAFFSSSETVLFSLTSSQRARIRERSAKADARIGRCLSDKSVLFSTLLIGNTFVNFIISTLGYCLFDNLEFAGSGLLALPVMTMLLLIFGEITPKRLALRLVLRLRPPQEVERKIKPRHIRLQHASFWNRPRPEDFHSFQHIRRSLLAKLECQLRR